jgi:hypothetical protein
VLPLVLLSLDLIDRSSHRMDVCPALIISPSPSSNTTPTD